MYGLVVLCLLCSWCYMDIINTVFYYHQILSFLKETWHIAQFSHLILITTLCWAGRDSPRSPTEPWGFDGDLNQCLATVDTVAVWVIPLPHQLRHHRAKEEVCRQVQILAQL